MRSNIRRYWRALTTALRLTLRGETVAPAPDYPQLRAWMSQGLKRVEAVEQAAAAQDDGENWAKTLAVPIEGHSYSLAVIIAGVRHNLTMEYPLLLETRYDHTLTTLYALNLDDQHRVQRLAEALADYPVVQDAVTALAEHLREIPSSTAS